MKMECKYYKEVNITVYCGTDKEEIKKFRICSNPLLMIERYGGILMQFCVYNETNEEECPFR